MTSISWRGAPGGLRGRHRLQKCESWGWSELRERRVHGEANPG